MMDSIRVKALTGGLKGMGVLDQGDGLIGWTQGDALGQGDGLALTRWTQSG
jgi:hypothetical protein